MNTTIEKLTKKNQNVVVQNGEQCDLVIIHNEQLQEPITKKFVVSAGARLRVLTVLAASVDITMDAQLLGDGAVYEHRVIYFGTDKDRMRIRMTSVHQGKNTMARMLIRGIALKAAHIDFAGMIDIAASGNGTDARLEHEGLLMSKKARIDALPGFEIATNTVKAAHSSAVHYLRPEQLFYLQSRGIDQRAASQMIVSGFFDEMMNTLGESEVRTHIQQLLAEKQQLL
ncbi:MAG: SufD family Fe-S cluster assembly protein [Candidatus Kerfeldbacteria bacterium]|nr:SufD family Fe-S cluster assembly protein [Candidatus Kerfeldbacteria bacterium]